MKKHLTGFLTRGLMAASGGPLILAIILGVEGYAGRVTAIHPAEVCTGILTITLLAFIAAGLTEIYQIEQLPLVQAMMIHGAALYVDYLLIYLVNGWLRQQLVPILVFTGIFAGSYGIISLLIYRSVKKKTDRINRKLLRKDTV